MIEIEQNLTQSTNAIKLLDSTLRDGSYAVDFQFDRAFVADLTRKLGEIYVGLVELGHGMGFEAERMGFKECNINLSEWCEIANENLGTSCWGMFAQPEFSQLSTLSWLGTGSVRCKL